MSPKEREKRFTALKGMKCLCCVVEDNEQHMPTEIHHLNFDGKAGQKRRGDEYTVPLCSYHHRGVYPEWITGGDALYYWGPSLARNSRLFRETYGTDDQLLQTANEQIGAR